MKISEDLKALAIFMIPVVAVIFAWGIGQWLTCCQEDLNSLLSYEDIENNRNCLNSF